MLLDMWKNPTTIDRVYEHRYDPNGNPGRSSKRKRHKISEALEVIDLVDD